ncbi:MAG: hypothetical protein HKN91_02705 [Acidimicrobiia bacterium]|nr:hypothetical protein [Acidimicrobiia bacterium]
MAQWIYHFTPGDRSDLARNPAAWTAHDEKVAAQHAAHIAKSAKDGIVILAGRSLDGIGPAVVIFEMATGEEAEAFMRSDPFVREGLFGADLHPFRAAFMRSS